MRKLICVLLVAVLAVGMFAGCAQNEGEAVSVQSVSMITGYGLLGLYDRYAGIVEAGKTVEVRKDESLSVGELFVAVGDSVKAGDLLFNYDLDAVQIEVEKAQLDLDQMNNEVETKTAQLEQLEKEKEKASADRQIDYTLQIQEMQLDLSQTKLNIEAKQRELERLQALTGNIEVRAELDGRVKTVNDPNSESYDPSKPFLELVQTDTYRVKGTINEQYAYNLYEGMPVLIRSRVDETQVWPGSVETVDLENPVSGNQGGYYYYDSMGDEMTSSSKYNFYILLDHDEGLMMGQHVYIEPDVGQQDEGLWLPACYLVDAESAPYVWAANKSDKLEKRSVTLGDYDGETDSWKIVAGLGAEDYIAFPDDTCKAGASVVYYDENSFDTGVDEGFYGGAIVDDGGYVEDGYVEDGGYAEDGEPIYEGAIITDGAITDGDGTVIDVELPAVPVG